MPKAPLSERVGILEEKVEELEALPARVTGVESQIVQLRDEVRAESSAIRLEVTSLGTALRGELADLAETLRGEIRELREELRAEIRAGDEETRRHMQVLHEDLVSRIALLAEARRPRRTRG